MKLNYYKLKKLLINVTNLKSGFKREIIWNKYRSQMTTEAVNNNLNILIDPTFTNVNRLFVLAY